MIFSTNPWSTQSKIKLPTSMLHYYQYFYEINVNWSYIISWIVHKSLIHNRYINEISYLKLMIVKGCLFLPLRSLMNHHRPQLFLGVDFSIVLLVIANWYFAEDESLFSSSGWQMGSNQLSYFLQSCIHPILYEAYQRYNLIYRSVGGSVLRWYSLWSFIA